jgi:predicted permease
MDGYLPLSFLAQSENSNDFWSNRGHRELFVLGRLKRGISRHSAQASVDVIAKRLAAEYASTDDKFTIRLIPERMSRPAPFVSSFVPIVAALFLGLAGMVLVLACINVANILLARATARQREMGIRAALGAGRVRLIRQVLTESLLLALLGGAAGASLGKWAIAATGSLLHSIVTTSSNLGYSMDCSFDWRVFAYTLGAAVLTGVIAGLWPAFRAGRTDILTTLRDGARGASGGPEKHRVRSVLVVVQVACSLMLLVVAGLFVRSLGHAERMYLGFDPDHVLNVMLDPRQIGYSDARSIDLYRELVEHVRAMPGVQSASVAFSVPMSFPGHSDPLYVEGHAVVVGEQPPKVSSNSIDPGYLRTMRVPLLQGRDFKDSDDEKAPRVAIVNQAMANRFWPNQDPLGKRFSLKSAGGPFIEVVGVAHDGQYFFLSPDSSPYFYVPFAQNPSAFAALQLRSSIPPELLIQNVQQEINKLAPDLPAIDIHTMDQTVHGLAGMFIFRLAAALAATMGVLGLVLAVVGVYGMVAFSVTRRTQEIGIRIALGAERGDIIKLVSRQGLRLVIAGVTVGVVVALILTRAMGRLLMGVSAADPATYLSVAVLLSAVVLLACYIPARRATAVDPMVALRYE